MNKDFWIWLAGFTDGEGTISIYRRNEKYKSFRIDIIWVNSEIQLLKEIQQKVGGYLYIRKKDENHYGRKLVGQLKICSNKARLVLEKIYPYLRIKKKQAEICLKFPLQKKIGKTGKGKGGAIPDYKTKKIQERLYNQVHSA